MGYVELARATSPRGDVLLRRRDDPGTEPVVELRVNGVFVMDTRETGSERALATAALAAVSRPRSVLVGGLGLGFTTSEVLRDLRVERVEVVEIEADLVRWMRDGTVPGGADLLRDDRLLLVTGDVRDTLREAAAATYDLVLLDLDNGPGSLVHDSNAEVYRAGFLGTARAALRPGGAVAVWSSAPAPELESVLRRVFGAVSPVPYDVRLQHRDERYWVYLAPR